MLLGTSLKGLVALLDVEVASVAFKNSFFFRKLILLPVVPANLFEQPFFAKMRRYNSMLIHLVSRYQLIQKPEQLVNLLPRKVRVVTGVFHLKRISVLTFSCHQVRQRTQAWVADRNPHRIVPELLQVFHEHGLTVEPSLAPAAKPDSINFPNHNFKPQQTFS